jgi:hypothetical protein
MPQKMSAKSVNRKGVVKRAGKPMPRTTSGSTFKRTSGA